MKKTQKISEIVEIICGGSWTNIEKWKNMSFEDQQGAYGVGIVLAYLSGVQLNMKEIANYLDLSVQDIALAFEKLCNSNLFNSKKFNLNKDSSLLGNSISDTAYYLDGYWSDGQAFISSWCHIAGIASGLIERNIA